MAPALIETPVDSTAEAVWKKDQRQGNYKVFFSLHPSLAGSRFSPRLNESPGGLPTGCWND